MGSCLSSPPGVPFRAAKTEIDVASQTSSTIQGLPKNEELPIVRRSRGHYVYLEDGRKIIDGSGGAAVACIGHGRKAILRAAYQQGLKVSYMSWAHFQSRPFVELEAWLVQSTGNVMQKAYIMSSGSEAVEAALKMAREYHIWNGQPQRTKFIGRHESYHGTTLGSLSASGHVVRRAHFEPLLPAVFHRITSCNMYRQQKEGESLADFVSRKAQELEDAFQSLGPHTVAAVILEPVVGAALGCAPAAPGYLKAMQYVCHRHGALLILDEIMCGIGRTGSLHAWQQEGVVPDLQTIGKGVSGGYVPASALLVSAPIVETMRRTGSTFTHGHTFQNHPVVCATALKVLQVIQKEHLVENVYLQGRYLETLLRQHLASHPNVGDIRGRGLFWGVEFVKDKATKAPFDRRLQISNAIHKRCLQAPYNLLVYYGQGCAGQANGDHIMIMPAYNVDKKLLEDIVNRLRAVIEEIFCEIPSGDSINGPVKQDDQ